MISEEEVEALKLTKEQTTAVKKALKDFRFILSHTYRDQVYRLRCLLHKDEDEIVSYDTIGKLFKENRTHGTIIDQFKKSLIGTRDPYKTFILTNEEEEKIEELLIEEGSNYLTIDEIGFFVIDNFNKCPSSSTLKRTIRERIKGHKIIKVKAIVEDRYEVSLEDIKKFYKQLAEEVEGVPVGFLFNLDESGENQFIDARNIYIIVPADEDVTTYPVNKRIKRITLIHCIDSDGSSCDPLIIIPRKTLDDEIFDEIPTGKVLFASQPKDFCIHELFSEWFLEKFISYLIAQQDYYKYTGKSAIIMDGFKGHDKSLETLKEVLKQYKIKILFIPPHSSDQIQPLDLFGFNIQKYKTSKFIFNHHYSMQTNQILAILDGLNEITSAQADITAWRMAGVFRKRNSNEGTIIQQLKIMKQDYQKCEMI